MELLDCAAMRMEELEFDLPREQIAQRPLVHRQDSRLLKLNRATGAVEDGRFRDFPGLLRGDELLVLNNARVIPARLFGKRAGLRLDEVPGAVQNGISRGRVEVFLLRRAGQDTWEALVRPGRKMPIGERVLFGEGELEGEVIARGELGERTIRFCSHSAVSVTEHVERLGHVPLPPYIDRIDEASDRERYQTVFATQPGAVAAPTAGLHFTPEILQAIRDRGAEICELTLDVGLGTFQPVHTETLEDHSIHSESYEIPRATAERICAAKAAGRPIVAIGTTVVRALEDSALRAAEAGPDDLILAGRGEARVFITPGFPFRVVDALLTNFHLPRSTLLALVCAFAGRDPVLAAYRHAVSAGYRFYSYGDCMWIR
jgi:S-adenosylmethionine:tRNA ribosyltransferase-isomerase